MKANDFIILDTFVVSYNQTNSIIECIKTLYRFNHIDNDKCKKLINLYKETNSLKDLLIELNINKVILEYILFYNNYYTLSKSIIMSIDIYKQRYEIKKNIVSSLLYPSILVFMTSCSLFFIVVYIIPQIAIINPEAFLNYQLLFSILKVIALLLFTFLILLVLLIVFFIWFIKSKNSLKYMDRLVKIPVLNGLIKTYISINFVMYLKEITKNNKFNNDCIKHLYNQVHNSLIKNICLIIMNRLKDGVHIFEIINSLNLLSNDLKQTIVLSHNSTSLNGLLCNYYNIKTNLIINRIKNTLSILMPIIISLIGITLVFMYLIIMLPILDSATTF